MALPSNAPPGLEAMTPPKLDLYIEMRVLPGLRLIFFSFVLNTGVKQNLDHWGITIKEIMSYI